MRKIISILILFFIFYTNTVSAASDKAELTDVVLNNTRDELIFYLKVKGVFNEKIKKTILSGAPVSFSFIINLYKVKELWFDSKISSITINHTIKYDNVKNEYIITKSEESGKTFIAKSFEEAMQIMTGIEGLKVISVNLLEKGGQYQIRAKVELSKVTLPFSLHYILFFVSFWDVETDWYTINFIY